MGKPDWSWKSAPVNSLNYVTAHPRLHSHPGEAWGQPGALEGSSEAEESSGSHVGIVHLETMAPLSAPTGEGFWEVVVFPLDFRV